MDQLLKIGVVGCGAIGREHIKRVRDKIAGARIVAVTDVFADSAKKASELCGARIEPDAAALINAPDVDAVIVTTPGFAHAEPVLQAIAAGKPVFCEKPLATTAEDCKRVVDAEVASGKHLVQVGFMRRYDKGYNQVKDLLDSGDFGAPLLVKCTHRAEGVDDSYTTAMAVTDTAIHEIDVLQWLIGDVWASAQVVYPRNTVNAHEGLRDPQLMLLTTRGGIVVTLEVFVNCRFGYDINCEVVCEDGVIHMPAPSWPTVRKNGQLSTKIEDNWMRRFIDAYDAELAQWVDACKRGVVEGPTAWDGYVAELTADALVAAQTSGKVEPILSGDKPAFYGA